VRALGIQPAIKWPNDVLVEGRKVGGSLTECVLRGEAVDFLVLGVGVNLNVSAESLRRGLGEAATTAISLATAIGREVDRNAFAVSYLNRLDEWALRFRNGGPRSILEAWRDLDILTGRRVTVRSADASYIGRVLGLTDEAQLVVQDSLGRHHVVLTEEIRAAD
jgi:BirA family biotin operon repressor/biotin-[acetyl-CoA-carboxylase] ligase